MRVILRLLSTIQVNKCLLFEWKSLKKNNQEETGPPLTKEAQQTALICII